MNILIDALPNKISGCKVRTDYRVWLRVMRIVGTLNIDRITRDLDYFAATMDEISALIFTEWPDFYTIDTLHEVGEFLSCKGAEQVNIEGRKSDGSGDTRLFDMDFDSGAIYASFLGQYGIDLVKTKQLHWYLFNVLLQSLTEDSPLRVRAKIRSIKHGDVPKDKLAELKRVQGLYRVPVSDAEKAQREVLTKLLKGGDK